jgi:hypothetical protein
VGHYVNESGHTLSLPVAFKEAKGGEASQIFFSIVATWGLDIGIFALVRATFSYDESQRFNFSILQRRRHEETCRLCHLCVVGQPFPCPSGRRATSRTTPLCKSNRFHLCWAVTLLHDHSVRYRSAHFARDATPAVIFACRVFPTRIVQDWGVRDEALDRRVCAMCAALKNHTLGDFSSRRATEPPSILTRSNKDKEIPPVPAPESKRTTFIQHRVRLRFKLRVSDTTISYPH